MLLVVVAVLLLCFVGCCSGTGCWLLVVPLVESPCFVVIPLLVVVVGVELLLLLLLLLPC